MLLPISGVYVPSEIGEAAAAIGATVIVAMTVSAIRAPVVSGAIERSVTSKRSVCCPRGRAGDGDTPRCRLPIGAVDVFTGSAQVGQHRHQRRYRTACRRQPESRRSAASIIDDIKRVYSGDRRGDLHPLADATRLRAPPTSRADDADGASTMIAVNAVSMLLSPIDYGLVYEVTPWKDSDQYTSSEKRAGTPRQAARTKYGVNY